MQRTYRFKGGEAEALKRLQHYLWSSDAVADYFNTRNGAPQNGFWYSCFRSERFSSFIWCVDCFCCADLSTATELVLLATMPYECISAGWEKLGSRSGEGI